ncbi:beta/gamma crystallin domain-containing protein 1-like [Carassius auratus]|uniref:Beta/gamma crystallin domain-containing protein 1-like n=1 Tax=Carassius auratus TaxID=7957 RepID=A0A6P6K1G4_CARAU|nr:beta/gamma crystallin domain-containing protein 1-like [Carassius auratus]
MGRKRSGRRRRSSHGDEGGAQTKSPTNPQPESPATTSLTSSPRTACADSAVEEAANSLQEPNSGRREDVVRVEYLEANLSEDSVEVVCSDMDEERVVRLTESAESKRRSIKVSHSEVVFAKKVVVTSEDQNEDQNMAFKDTTDTKRPRAEETSRFPEDRVDGTNVKSSHNKARIADKISLFERGATSAVSSSTNLRHLDIPPAQNVASRLRDLTEHAGTRSSSAPPNQTVKERAKNFSTGRREEEKLTLTSGRMLNEGHSKTTEISCSGRFEKSIAKTDTSGESKFKSKPHLNIDQPDSKSYSATPASSESTGDSSVGNKKTDSLPTVSSPTDKSPQVKSPTRTGTRSKKRRGKDPLSPTKQEMGQGKQEVKDKPLVDARDVVKTPEQNTSDKERPNKKPSVPPKLEKAEEIMQSTQKKSDSKNADTKLPSEVKSKDEKESENSGDFEAQIVAVASQTYPSTSRKDSSNKEKIQTDIDSKTEEKQKNSNKKQHSEGEQGDKQRNRAVIVNSLFGESDKPDPSVTKEEKPLSPEDLKETRSKDSSEPANSSAATSRNNAMPNCGNETDTLVLPEKPVNTPENSPKSAQRLSEMNRKSQEKDCLTSQNQKIDLVTEITDQLKTTETHKHSKEVKTSKPTELKIERKSKQAKSKDITVVRQQDKTIMGTSQGKETQTTEKNSELSNQTKGNTTSTSKTPATPNPALVKDQNDKMDTIISPQIASTEGGGPNRDGPPQQSQSESREQQKTETLSSKRDLHQKQQKPSTETKKGGTKETKSKITVTEMTFIVNGDIHSVETEDQFSDKPKQSGKEILGKTLPEIPSNNESPSLSSFSSEATVASTEQPDQVSKNFTAKPASTDYTLSNSANKKTTNEKTTHSASSTVESTSTSLGSDDDKTTPPSNLTNETTTIPPTSTNEKTKSSLDLASRKTNNEETMTPPASTNKTTNDKSKPSSASTNDKTTPAKSLTKENAVPSPASTTETISASLGSSDEKNKRPPDSTNPAVSTDITTKNERTTPLPGSSSFPITPMNGENIVPIPLSKEKTKSPPDYDSGKTTPSPESVNEKPSALEVSVKQKISSSKSIDPSTRKKEFVLKPFLLPQIPNARSSSSQSRDSPSSWLDVDNQRPIRKKLLIPDPKLSSSVSETNLLNTSGEFDPDDFVANVKRLAMPFNLPQRKHNKHRLQTPPFAMPAIKEDRFEKPFDPEEFQYGLRRRKEFTLDLATSSTSKSQATIVKEVDTKPKRESILTRSLIFQRARKESEKEEGENMEESVENTTEPLKAKSRLERCSIVSILRSPNKVRRMEFLSPTECPSDGLLSPIDGSGSTAPPQSRLAPTTEPPTLVPVEETFAKNDSRGTQSGSYVILKPNKDIGSAVTPDLKTTSRDPTVTLSTDTNAPSPPSGTPISSQVVPKPTKDDGTTLAPDSKTISTDPSVTMITDTNVPTPSCTQSYSQDVQKPTKDDGLSRTSDLSTASGDTTVTMLTDTNAPSPSGAQTSSQFVSKPMKDDGPTLQPDLKRTSLDPPVTMLTDIKAAPTSSYTQSGSQNVLKPINDDIPAMKPDLRTISRDPTVKFTDTNAQPLLIGTHTGTDVVLQPDGPTRKTTPVEPTVTKVPDANAPPPLPSFDDIKLPSVLEEFLPKKPENAQPSNKINPLVARESASTPGLVDLNKAVDEADGKVPEDIIPPAPVVPAAQIPQAKPQRELPNIPAVRGIHRRPGKIVIFEHHHFSGQSFEFYRDQPDATHMQLSGVISIKVVRGCWILYEKPGFEGRCIALEEEGVVELPNQWAEEGEEASVVIGSIRLAVRDYTPPRIELFSEPAGRGRSSEYLDYTEEVGSFSHPQNTASIKVHSGLWMVYSDPGFQGLLAVLEAGEYPFPEDWGFLSPAVGSLRPLRMGALKVEKPNAVKAVLYEKAGLEGRCVEVHGDVTENHGLDGVQSLKILGGLWVGYDGEGFEGQQFVLEEGEYLDWTDWGGTGDKLLSLRPVLMDFSSPHMKMFSEPDFSERGVSLDLLEPLDNAVNTPYGPQTRSIEVLSGVWVVFEDPWFSGQQYVLEKGLYGSPEDWGAAHSRISSVIPVILENLENSCHFQIELFSESGFGGTSVLLQDSLPTMPCGFSVRSCRVYAGSWLAFSRDSFSGHQCVLEEGFYPNLWTMGFTQPDESVLSLQPTGHELSVPAAVLFERSGLRGRRTVLKSGSVNLQMTHSCSRVSSVLVQGGIWVLYEDHNFRGSQILLKPGAVPDWPKLSSWLRIGSLRPLIQKQVHFRLRNKEAGLLMSVSGSLDDIKLMRIQVSEETGGAEQIWTYQDGLLQCKCVLDVCVDVSSGVLMSGSRAVLSAELGKQLWNVTSDGIIRSDARPELVLEVKGGQQFDKRQIILNEFHPDKLNQRWTLEIL